MSKMQRSCHALGFALTVLFVTQNFTLAQTMPPTTQPANSTAGADKADQVWKGEILLGMQRTRAVRDQCLQEGLQAETGRQAALLNSRIPEGAAFARLANEKAACVERADEELAQMQSLLDAGRGYVAAVGDRFQQDYERGLRALFTWLQQLAQQLQEPEAVKYEVFTPQMDGFRRQLDGFKTHYIRLLNTGDNQKFASTLFQASDVLIASAGAWWREMEAERAVSKWTEPGDQRAATARRQRDAAAADRRGYWQTAQRLIQEARVLAEAKWEAGSPAR